MRVPLQIVSFSCFLFSFTFVQSQECLREDIKYENTELAAKAAYTNGETVRVSCMTGYIGLYKLKCENGQWKKLIGRSCAKKKCSHPGDTPNGDFKLMEGTEYVFGATVVYTCKKRYKMTSRINQRTCRAQGWDNAIPVCEAVKCPAIRTDGDVAAFGNTKEGSYGDVIHFECVSSDKMIDGSSDIHCEETGKWSGVVPKCKEITCTAPVISNGYIVKRMPEYQKDAILKYSCNPGFKKREGIPRCAKFGWTLNPECHEVTCDLKSTTFGVKKIIPKGKIIFRAGESVEITCSEKYWLIFAKETSRSFTCKDNGEWDLKPVCEEIRCEVPRDHHVSSPYYYFRGDMKLGAKQYYYCESGYEKMAEEATCTRDGWTPKPLCAEVTCQFESITSGVKRINPEGKTIFKVGESVEIICSDKHLIFTKETNKVFTCQSNGKWDSKPGCEITCEVPHDQHVSGPEYYFSGEMKLGSRRYYSCKSRYQKTASEATCTRDGWAPKPLCAEIMCDPPKIPNAEIAGGQKLKYKISSRIQYKCRPGFEPEQPVQITCDSQGQWTGIQQCTDGTCQEQELKNIEILCKYPSISSPYKPGHILVFRCTDDNMRFYGQRAIECQPDGRWNYPYPQCGGTVQCSRPTKNLQFVTLSDEKTEYSNSETLTYTCNKPYNETQGGVLKCLNGNWNGTFDCKSKICPPPLYLQHGDYIIINSTKDKVITAVSYTCQSYFVLTKQQDVYKCVEGKWETPPKCLRPCEIDDIVEKYSLQLPTGKVYIRHAEKYRLNCRNGWHTGSEMKAYVDVSCSDGNLQIGKSCDAQNN